MSDHHKTLNDAPAWMLDRARKLADETGGDRATRQHTVDECIAIAQEAGREVAFYFAGQDEKASPLWAKAYAAGWDEACASFHKRAQAPTAPVAAAEPMEFKTGNADLDHLLECTYWLNGAANMDSGIEWSDALEKVQAALATPVAAAEPSDAELRRIGGQMANVMFNVAQRRDEGLTAGMFDTMDDLRKQWDAAVLALRTAGSGKLDLETGAAYSPKP